jgi:pimeloyl-ACP methyl ester carboxylesterase
MSWAPRSDNQHHGGGDAAKIESGFRNRYFTSRDGLRLHVRCYGHPVSDVQPVVCLPGLTRNARDFHALALALSAAGPGQRQVFSVDYRGRGQSQWDADWRHYTPLVEAADVLDFLTIAGLSRVMLVGTSRGGILSMLIAAMRPRAVSAIVLNDIGPIIESLGMMRIAGYVGRAPLPASWQDAYDAVKATNRLQFPAVSDAEWQHVARALYDDLAGVPGPSYDPNLGKTLGSTSSLGRMPELWGQFKALYAVPVLVLRGEHSDILSATTVKRMQELHPNLQHLTIAGQGHAPLLRDITSIGAIQNFLDRCAKPTVEATVVPVRAVA